MDDTEQLMLISKHNHDLTVDDNPNHLPYTHGARQIGIAKDEGIRVVANEKSADVIEVKKTPTFVYMLTFVATLGGFLFGYDIGIVSGSMLFIQPYFKLSKIWQEVIVAGTVGAAAVAALVSGWLTDKIGRKPTTMVSAVIFIFGGILMGLAPTKELLLMGRIVAGIGVGIASVVVPIYVAEAAPVHIRGRLVSLHQTLINTGIVVSSLVSGAFSYVKPDGWRYMLGFAAIPGAIQLVGFIFLPESPRWLVDKGHIEVAKSVLVRIRGHNDITEELDEILITVTEAQRQKADGFQHIIKIIKTPHVRKAVIIGSALLFFQQWCGINIVIYYSGTVLNMAGFPVRYAIWLVVVPNTINLLSNFIELILVESLGRRTLLISSLAGTIIGLVVLAFGFHLQAEFTPGVNQHIVELGPDGHDIIPCQSMHSTCESCVKDASCGFCYSNSTDGTCLPSHNEVFSSAGRCEQNTGKELGVNWAYGYCPSDYTFIALFGMAVFVCAFAIGLGPIPWTVNAEIYPLWARSTCNSLASFTAWANNLVISFVFLTITESITIYGSFWLFTAVTVGGIIFVAIFLPETKDKTLEEMEQLFMTKEQRDVISVNRIKDTEDNIVKQ